MLEIKIAITEMKNAFEMGLLEEWSLPRKEPLSLGISQWNPQKPEKEREQRLK